MNDILSHYPSLRGGRFWKDEHDSVLLRAVLRHGYSKWLAIIDDKELRIQDVICQELNLPIINLPVTGQAGSQVQSGVNNANAEGAGSEAQGSGTVNEGGGDVTHGVTDAGNHSQQYQDSTILYHFRDMQRQQVEFVKKMVLLLEKGLNAEYQKEYFGDSKPDVVATEEQDVGQKVAYMPSGSSTAVGVQVVDELPRIDLITSEEIAAAACDDNTGRLEVAQKYNKVCNVLEENRHESVKTSSKLKENLRPVERLSADVAQILSFPKDEPCAPEQPILEPNVQSAHTGTGSQLMAQGDNEPIEMKDPAPTMTGNRTADLSGSEQLENYPKVVEIDLVDVDL